MSSTHHAKRLYVGTSAERTALSLTADGRGIVWYDTDEDRAYIWSGSAWVEATKISEIYESDGGGPAWSTDASGHLSATAKDLTTTGDVTANDVSASGSVTITGAGQSFKGDGSSEPDLGTTAAGGKIGSIYMAGGEIINAPTSFSLTAGAVGSDVTMVTLTNTTQDVLDLGDVAGTGDVDIDFNNDQMFLEGSSGNFRVSAYAMADANGFIVKNTSGSAASAGDVGYLDGNNEYQVTSTAEDQKSTPVAVLVGGANNADIYVTRGPGRATLNYVGSAPSSGDFLEFSATAGKTQGNGTVMHPGVLARAGAGGSGGTVEVELLLRRANVNISPAEFMFRVDLAADSDFVALIDSLPGGAAVRYDTPTSGAENCIVPNSTNNFAKIVLHNTTRGDYALIDTVNTTGGAGYDGEITLTANVPGTWQVGDTITARSQTNTNVQGTSYWFDCELLNTTEVPDLATKLYCQVRWLDSSGVGESQAQHPFKAFNSPDAIFTNGQVANQALYQYVEIPLIQRRFQVLWTASGAATGRPRLRLLKAEVAA